MKYLIIYLFTMTSALAGFPPTTTKGQGEITKTTTFNFEVPYFQRTQTAAGTALVETGNENELVNPSFEHTTVSTGWNTFGTVASSTDDLIGNKSISLTSVGSGIQLDQSSAQNTPAKDGVQMVASAWVKSSNLSGIQLCSMRNGVDDKCTPIGAYTLGSGWRQLVVSFLGHPNTNGIRVKANGTSGTVLVDNAYMGVGSPVVDFTPDNTYSAKISSTGVVSEENTDWINGNCSVTATNKFTCSYITGFATVPLNCSIVQNAGAQTTIFNQFLSNGESSSTAFVAYTYAAASPPLVAEARAFNVICQKQGADYKTSKAYVASSSDYGWTAFTPTSPNSSVTFSSSSCFHSRQGQNLLIRCYGVASASTASEARIALPSSLVSSSSIPTIQIAGDVARSGFSATYFRNVVLIEPSVAYLTFGRQDSTQGAITKATGASSFGTDTVSFTATVPIAGWENANVIVGSFQSYNETPGTSRVESFSFSFGTTNSQTACTATPCSYLNQIGNNITSVTRGGTGSYTINFAKTFSNVKCVGNTRAPGVRTTNLGDLIECQNCSSKGFVTQATETPYAVVDSIGTFYCQGTP